MAYLSLYRKYRPQNFDEILGQEHVALTLTHAIEQDRVAHAYLFTGPRGTGKTSTARVLAKALNCAQGPTPNPCGVCASCVAISNGSSLDVIELDAASHSKVEETRDILAGVALATAGGRRKVYVIDEVHMLTTGSFNALLKTLEEPPEHVVFILATTEAHKVLPTIVSRTQRFDFRRVPSELLEGLLERIAKLENIDIEHEALAAIARHAEGGARDAISSLDQLSSLGGHVSLTEAERVLGERGEEVYVEVFEAIASSDVAGVFTNLHSLVAQGEDVRQIALGVLGHARSLLLVKTSPEASGLLDVSDGDRAILASQADRLSIETLVRALDLLSRAITDMRNSPNHRLLLEVALVRVAAPRTDPSPGGLLGRIERLERRMGIESESPDSTSPAPARPDGPRPVVSAADSTSPAPEPASSSVPPPGAQAPRPRAPAETAAPGDPDPGPIAPAGAPDHIGVNHIKDAWPATLKEVNQRSKRVWGLLSPSRPLRFEGDALVVEVQSPFHETSMTEARNRAMLADSLHAALGVRPALRFAARGADGDAGEPDPAGGPNLADTEAVEKSKRHDPVDLLKKGLGAEIVEER